MSDDGMGELRAELLDDFYAECDELLSNVRQQLTALEQAPADPTASAAAVESCFRSMHSLKGNAAIVGLKSAEELAHAAEGRLREHMRSKTRLGREPFDLLAQASQRLEQIVSAHRRHATIPDVATLVMALAAPTHDATTATPPGAADGSAAQATDSAPATWACSFSPSRELDARGVNINSVRARLGAAGAIIAAAPKITPGGGMQFEFTVTLREPPGDLAAWAADGIVFRAPSAAPVPTSDSTPTEAAPAAAPASGLSISPSHVVRVDLSRLDELMRITGEMVIHRSRLEERIGRSRDDATGLQEVSLALGRSLRQLREALARVRLVAIAEIFTRMPFVVRDLARESDRRVRLFVDGQHTEIDKYLVERLKEPLLHLVRNAVSHGIESPEERAAAGKPEEATVHLEAEAVGRSIVIRVRDDGRGVDRARVASRATAAGIAVPDPLDDHALLDLLCVPGFSTRDQADRAAGRGVGMAVVLNTVRELGGSLSLSSQPGRGTQFTLRLPLTLSIAETFIVTVGEHICAIPRDAVQEIVLLRPAEVRAVQSAEIVPYRDGVLPLVRLRSVFKAPGAGPAQPPVLVLDTDRGRIGLVVDRVQGEREVVVRALNDPLIQVPGVSGATELGDGRPVLILDPAALATAVTRNSAREASRPPAPSPFSA